MANTTTTLQLILYIVYYLAIGILAVFSLSGVFLLAAHGRSRTLSLLASLVYIMFFLTILGTTQATLRSIF